MVLACRHRSCTFSAGILACHALVEATNESTKDGEEHWRIISLSMLQMLCPQGFDTSGGALLRVELCYLRGLEIS